MPGILLVLAVAGCGSAAGSSDESVELPLIAVHLASGEEESGLERVGFEGRALFVAAEPIVSDREIASVDPVVRGGEAVVLDIRLTPEGAERLGRATAGNIDRPVVLMFDSEIVGAPMIRSEVSGPRLQMVVPTRSADELDQIVERVRARW